MSPAVSVIIPTYNDVETLDATLASVLGQGHSDLEVILVNDGGRDPRDFIRADDPRLTVYSFEKNSGVSCARNFGLSRARGALVLFLDADDLIAGDMIGVAVAQQASTAAEMMCFRHYSVLDSDVGSCMGLLSAGARALKGRRLDSPDFYAFLKINTGAFIPSFTVLSRAALHRIMGDAPWDVSLKNCEDTLLFLQVGSAVPVFFFDEAFGIYRIRPNSLSRNALATWSGRVRAMDKLMAWLDARGCDPQLIHVARQMRQNGARRVARLHRAEGRRAQGRQELVADLRSRFNWKSAAELLRHLLPR